MEKVQYIYINYTQAQLYIDTQINKSAIHLIV